MKLCAMVRSLALVVGSATPAWADGAQPSAEVVIEGERDQQRAPRDDSVSAESIPRERLQAPGLSAAAALRSAPGVAVTELGGLGASASSSIRASTAAQTPVYLASVRINDEVGGSADLATLPLWFMERVEVYRGNAPVDADRWGPGGSIFFEPRKPDGRLTLGALVGSRSTRGGYATASTGTPENGVIAGVGFEAANNAYPFTDNRGTAFVDSDDRPDRISNADAELFGVWLHARRKVGRAGLGLLAHYGSLERGVARVANASATLARERLERRLTALSARTPFGPDGNWFEAHTRLLASTSEVADPGGELGLPTTEVETTGIRVGQVLALRLEPLRGLLVRPALDTSVERLARREARSGPLRDVPVLEASRLDLRPSVSSELVLTSALSLRTALAVECASATTATLEACSEHPLSGRIGPTLRGEHWLAYLNLGRYARSPTLGERFGTSAAVRGEPDLRSEVGETLDLGGRFRDRGAAGISVSAAGFVRRAENLIVFTRTAQGYVVAENRDRARVLGLEFSAGSEPLRGLELDVGLTLTDARDTSPERRTVNDVLPFYSRLMLSPGISYSRKLALGPLHGAKIVARYRHQSSRYTDSAGLAVIPEQGNLELSGEAQLADDAMVLRLRVDNALDQSRFDVVGFPLPGTSLYASLEARL